MASDRKPVKIYPPVYFVFAFLLMVGLDFGLPIRDVIPTAPRRLGIAIVLAGVALNIWAAGLFTRAGTNIKPLEPSSALVVQGPFRWSRNPMYLGMAISLLGLGVLLGSLTPFAVVPAFMLWIQHRFIRREEAMLETTFGAAYAEYRSKVRRWL